MSKWKPGRFHISIKEYGYNQIWTDIDLAKFSLIAFVSGIMVGPL
jgi:hypothetical protein